MTPKNRSQHTVKVKRRQTPASKATPSLTREGMLRPVGSSEAKPQVDWKTPYTWTPQPLYVAPCDERNFLFIGLDLVPMKIDLTSIIS